MVLFEGFGTVSYWNSIWAPQDFFQGLANKDGGQNYQGA